jgi:osmotically-inducible protein OsmY
MKTTRTLLIASAIAALTPLGVTTTHAADFGIQRIADEAPDADDTGKNVRDRDEHMKTPMDQGESEGDRTITQNIRKSIVDNDQLSMNAKNVKVITVDGTVTLRGPVKTDAERATIASVAQKTPGVKKVENLLEVEKDK